MTVDWSRYPPAPVAFGLAVVDGICHRFGSFFWDWRDWMPFVDPNEGWLSTEFRMETPFADILPKPLTFSDFYTQSSPSSSLDPSLRSSSSMWFKYAFQTPSTSLSVLTEPQALVVVAVFVLILRRCKAIALPYFSRIGRKAARLAHGTEWESIPANQIRIVKFGEYVFRLIFHSCMSIYGVWYSYRQIWWQPGKTYTLFDGYPFHPVDPGMTWYYLIQCAYNVEAMISLLEMSIQISFLSPFDSLTITRGKSEVSLVGLRVPVQFSWKSTVRGDFQEMFAHHIVTNSLIFASSHFRFTRIGSMVFLVHDLSDVPVDASKLANFLKHKRATEVCFETMVLIWMVTRLYVFPFTIFRSSWADSDQMCNTGALPPSYYRPISFCFWVLLGLLILLHLAWFLMFIQMFYILLKKGEAHDLSEHKQGEKEEEQRQEAVPMK